MRSWMLSGRCTSPLPIFVRLSYLVFSTLFLPANKVVPYFFHLVLPANKVSSQRSRDIRAGWHQAVKHSAPHPVFRRREGPETRELFALHNRVSNWFVRGGGGATLLMLFACGADSSRVCATVLRGTSCFRRNRRGCKADDKY